MQEIEAALAAALSNARAGAAAAESSEYASAANLYSRSSVDARRGLVALLSAEASAALSSGDNDRAKRAALEATRTDSNAGIAWYWVGAVSHAREDYPAAKTAFEKAARLETDRTKIATYLDWARRCDEIGTASDPDGDTSGKDLVGSGRISNDTPGNESTSRDTSDKQISETSNHLFVQQSTIPPAIVPHVHETPRGRDPRMEWYQSSEFVTIDVYAKNVDKDKSQVKITSKRIFARLIRPEMDDYVFDRQLFGSVRPSESSWTISKFKVEVKLRKEDAATEWKSLSAAGGDASANERARVFGEQRIKAVARTQKDWDEIAAKELEGYKEGDDVMEVFKSIYAGADDDTRRAMMKSYTESGGKVLSTDWSDVKQRKVEFKEDRT